ncbi:YqhR family membrane protein [Cytobacillus purgationiresistens]|uniref:Tetrahydromethanopterin S-methyltransferase subunit G n=1 Tax=Cytobacillus purgationiresistens TaxID=863449 RepID=A0ABU0ADT5_9BACI|nr:YqhR family membrane protein [Cytobacillus purgationiresistens]MDQ0269408.1 tetrahydromethanopterin S-methyltransferase subunit G [Cytobacillus purgationiresistens]
MGEEHQELEQNEREKPMSLMTLTVLTGFIGGILWSGVGYLSYVLNFTEISPRVILEPWTIGEWKDSWLGTVIAIGLMGVISIVAALIYYVTLRRFTNMWIGAGYGIVIFLLVFFVLNPIFPGISAFSELSRDTIMTSVCLYLLYGIFVGYSISYETNELKKQKKMEKQTQTDTQS